MSTGRRTAAWLAFTATVAAVIATVAVPTLYIQPFRPQSGRGLTIAYALRQAAPAVTLAGCGVALVLGGWLWVASRRWWARALVVLLLAAAALPAWFVRQNHFEWMFAPLPAVEYAGVGDVDFLSDAEIVMGVQVAGVARAYPIRQLGYHHVVNTEVGGKPIVATY